MWVKNPAPRKENDMKILAFSPRATITDSKLVVERILAQEDVEHYDVMFTYDNPYPYQWAEVYKNIALNYNKMKKAAVDGGYDKVWIVESDTIPPLHALHHLDEVDAPVVSGVYPMRHGEPYPNLLRFGNTPNIGGGMKWGELMQSKDNIIQVSGGCMGCLLVETSVIKDFFFKLEKTSAPDVPFMEYCYANKIKQMARLDVQCGHIKANKDILYPDFNNEKGYMIVKARKVAALGHSIKFNFR